MDVKISKEDMALLKDIAGRTGVTQGEAATKLLHVGVGRQTALNTFADAKKAEKKATKKPAKKAAKKAAKPAAKKAAAKKPAKKKAAKKAAKKSASPTAAETE